MPRVDPVAVAMGLAFALMWSSAFTSARVIVTAAPPLAALALRFAISGMLAVVLATALGQSARLSWSQWRAVAVFGVCQNALYLGLYFFAMQTVPASVAAIVASTMPLLAAAAARLGGAEHLSVPAAAGLVAGLLGVTLIMGTRIAGGADPLGLALCVIGVCALTVATLSVRATGSDGNVLMIVGLQMLIGALALTPAAMIADPQPVEITGPLVAAFAYTLLVPGLAATVVWFRLVNRVGATRAAVFHFLNPVFGVAIAAAVLGEPLMLSDGVGVALIAAGIWVVQRRRASAGA